MDNKDFYARPWYIKYAGWLFLVGSFLIALFAILFYEVVKSSFGGVLVEMGQSGDTFGSLNAIFSGLAFLGVIFSLFIQRKELELSLEEMRESTKAQQLSSDALNKQLVSMERSNNIKILSERISAGEINDLDRSLAREIIALETKEILQTLKYKNIVIPELVHDDQKQYASISPPFKGIFFIHFNTPIDVNVDLAASTPNLKYRLTGKPKVLGTVNICTNFNGYSKSFLKSIELESINEPFTLETESTESNYVVDLLLTDHLTKREWKSSLTLFLVADHMPRVTIGKTTLLN